MHGKRDKIAGTCIDRMNVVKDKKTDGLDKEGVKGLEI